MIKLNTAVTDNPFGKRASAHPPEALLDSPPGAAAVRGRGAPDTPCGRCTGRSGRRARSDLHDEVGRDEKNRRAIAARAGGGRSHRSNRNGPDRTKQNTAFKIKRKHYKHHVRARAAPEDATQDLALWRRDFRASHGLPSLEQTVRPCPLAKEFSPPRAFRSRKPRAGPCPLWRRILHHARHACYLPECPQCRSPFMYHDTPHRTQTHHRPTHPKHTQRSMPCCAPRCAAPAAHTFQVARRGSLEDRGSESMSVSMQASSLSARCCARLTGCWKLPLLDSWTAWRCRRMAQYPEL